MPPPKPLAFKELAEKQALIIEPNEVLLACVDLEIDGKRVVPSHINIPEGLEIIEVMDLWPSHHLHGSFRVRNTTDTIILFCWQAFYYKDAPKALNPARIDFDYNAEAR